MPISMSLMALTRMLSIAVSMRERLIKESLYRFGEETRNQRLLFHPLGAERL
jgi:hypothetical protein